MSTKYVLGNAAIASLQSGQWVLNNTEFILVHSYKQNVFVTPFKHVDWAAGWLANQQTGW